MDEGTFSLSRQRQQEEHDELSDSLRHRRLDEINYDPDFNQLTTEDAPTWKLVYTCVVLVGVFAALISDKFGPDNVMLIALTLFMVAEIITIPEALQGFSNPGLLTVLILFVVAEGISKTGALDWYMGKLLGKQPNVSTPSAQFRLMLPVAFLSAFINNTPLVAVMLPLVQGWAQQIRVPIQQLLIPLSFAAILGGTCTLIGTSTNLVVVGLLADRYPDDPEMKIGLFDVGLFGVPVAMAGIAYVVLMSQYLLPGGKRSFSDELLMATSMEDILLGARVTRWSPASGRTVQFSGLRDTGGIYLVSVCRANTGNVHRAVSKDFVLSTGDILYFTGLVESFGSFCDEHGLEVVTNEVESVKVADAAPNASQQAVPMTPTNTNMVPRLLSIHNMGLETVEEDTDDLFLHPVEVGVTKESLLRADEMERIRNINRIADYIHGTLAKFLRPRVLGQTNDPARIIATFDRELVLIAINARDRSDLLLDINKSLQRFKLQVRHTEAAVIKGRSLSVWRCETNGTALLDEEEIWSVLQALLADDGIEAVKQRGIRVIRAQVLKGSRLIGKTAEEASFRDVYKAAIIAVKSSSDGKVSATDLASIRFDVGDLLVLQTSNDSPLLQLPPDDFYKNSDNMTRTSTVGGIVSILSRHLRSESTDGSNEVPTGDANNDEEAVIMDAEQLRDAVWKDLFVVSKHDKAPGENPSGEFLMAMQVAPNSQLAGKTVDQVGIRKLPDLFLVSIDRPPARSEAPLVQTRQPNDDGEEESTLGVFGTPSIDDNSIGSSRQEVDGDVTIAVDPNEPLLAGDTLWFSGPASAIGDLRKIPGLKSLQNKEVSKLSGKVYDRRLVQAVVARQGPLVGKTVKEIRFRSQYGAAVIAVQREGKRVHEHPGNIRLQASDVLLLEAGASFMENQTADNGAFVLLAQVANSAPPRMRMLLPALLITVGMLATFMAGLVSLLVSGLVASILMVCLGILSEKEAREAIKWDIYICIASALGIGIAMINTGIADAIAQFLVDISSAAGLGDAGLVGAVYFATALISNVVTNNAAAALLFPIAMNAAADTGFSRVTMAYTLMLGASACFMSPFGYTTNLLIFRPGAYKTVDFVRFGLPLQILLWVLSVLYLSVIKSAYISLVGSSRVAACSLSR